MSIRTYDIIMNRTWIVIIRYAIMKIIFKTLAMIQDFDVFKRSGIYICYNYL